MGNDFLQYGFSDDQNEVWNNVEKYTALIMKGDMNGFLEYFHNNYSGWNYNAFIPVRKADIKNELLHLPKREISSYKIIPMEIKIVKNIAIVHYSYSVSYKNGNKKQKEKYGHNTDILIKQKSKWMIIADHVADYKLSESKDELSL